MNFTIHANKSMDYLQNAQLFGKPRFTIFLAMKITTILIFICCFHVSANVFSQEINLNEKNAPLEKVMQKIRKQSGYAFIFDVAFLKKAVPVNANLKDKTLEESLKVIFSNQPFDYEIKGRTIILTPKNTLPIKMGVIPKVATCFFAKWPHLSLQSVHSVSPQSVHSADFKAF